MAANSHHDGNGVHTLIAVETDGKTLINILCDPTAHTLQTATGTTGSDNGPSNSFHDASHVPILMATSSLDGMTPIAVYGDISGDLLVDSF